MAARLSLGIAMLAAVSAASAPARAEWLPKNARAVPRTLSASRDAPVFELAYGPRAMLSLGAEPGLLRLDGARQSWHFGFSALFASESIESDELSPAEVWRDVETLFAALSFDAAARELFAGKLELALALGHESAHRTGSDELVDPYRSDDIPFGGGGWFLTPELAASVPFSEFELTSRLGDRVYANAWPMLFGARVQSDYVADYLLEGLAHLAYAELGVRWQRWQSVQPLVSVSGEAMIPHDDSARSGLLVRALFGAALPGAAGTVLPFVAGEAGNGKGLLINRRELRASVGVRYAL